MFLLFTNVIVFMSELVLVVVIHFLTCGFHRDAGDGSVISKSVVPRCKGFSCAWCPAAQVEHREHRQLPDVG